MVPASPKSSTSVRLRRLYASRSLATFSTITTLLFCSRIVGAEETNQLADEIARFKAFTLDELLNTEVTSVSRRLERLLDVPSAIQVITAEDIRRSGASSLPEALRLAPNLQVAQLDSRQWTISARGFNATTANKLLVLIDGRTVYTPLFAGVFWDVQNVLLEDVDRIEVISGPGAALWGANAVNGVVNVVSKSATQTQGLLVSGGGGSLLNEFGSIRYGDKLGKDFYYRVYGFGFGRDNTVLSSGLSGMDDWHLGQGGFRADWLPPQGDTVTFQGDFYGGAFSQAAPDNGSVNGENMLARWNHPFAQADFTLQFYWDRTWRRLPLVFSEELNTYDLDFQNRIPLGERNKFMWGSGYRAMLDRVGNSDALQFLPAKKNLQLFSGFAQDQIEVLPERVFVTVGTKLEHNDYSGLEVQPSVRVAWRPVTNQTVWAAVSRAIRSPSRIDTELFVPGSKTVGGGDDFDSEKLWAYELGYRIELAQAVTFSISGFYNDYDEIRSLEPDPDVPGQQKILNGLKAQTYGAELSATWQPADWWRLRGGYTAFKKTITVLAADFNQGRGEGNDPHHQFLIQSMFNLPAHFQFDSVLRYVDNLNQLGPSVPSYLTMDLRLAWEARPNLEFAIVGQNLLDNQHPEFGIEAARQEIPRSVYGKITWKF